MEEVRQNESFTSIPPAKKDHYHQNSEDNAVLPPSVRIYLRSVKESKTQIFGYQDRSRWLVLILKRLRESELQDKELIEEYLRHMYRHMCKASTVDSAYAIIHSFVTHLTINSNRSLTKVSREDIEAFVEHEQDRGLKLSTIRLKLVTLRAFLRFLIEQGYVGHEVLTRKIQIKLPLTLPKAMDPADVRQLLRSVTQVRDRALLLLLLRTGMRIGELINTKVGEVRIEEGKILVYQAQKTSTGRVVYFSKDAKRALKRWLKERDRRKEYLFYSQGGYKFTYGGAREIFVRSLCRAGLSHKGYTLHCLRHTFASELLNAGMRLECLQKLLGHTSLEVTRRYARLTDKTREEEYFKAMEMIERGEIDGHY